MPAANTTPTISPLVSRTAPDRTGRAGRRSIDPGGQRIAAWSWSTAIDTGVANENVVHGTNRSGALLFVHSSVQVTVTDAGSNQATDTFYSYFDHPNSPVRFYSSPFNSVEEIISYETKCIRFYFSILIYWMP